MWQREGEKKLITLSTTEVKNVYFYLNYLPEHDSRQVKLTAKALAKTISLYLYLQQAFAES